MIGRITYQEYVEIADRRESAISQAEHGLALYRQLFLGLIPMTFLDLVPSATSSFSVVPSGTPNFEGDKYMRWLVKSDELAAHLQLYGSIIHDAVRQEDLKAYLVDTYERTRQSKKWSSRISLKAKEMVAVCDPDINYSARDMVCFEAYECARAEDEYKAVKKTVTIILKTYVNLKGTVLDPAGQIWVKDVEAALVAMPEKDAELLTIYTQRLINNEPLNGNKLESYNLKRSIIAFATFFSGKEKRQKFIGLLRRCGTAADYDADNYIRKTFLNRKWDTRI